MSEYSKTGEVKQEVAPVTHNFDDVERSSTGDKDEVSPAAAEVLDEQPKRGWRTVIWDSLDKSPEERRLVFKIDCALLTIGCLSKSCSGRRGRTSKNPVFLSFYPLAKFCIVANTLCPGYFVKYLDQINVNNAFVSGMYDAPCSFTYSILGPRKSNA